MASKISLNELARELGMNKSQLHYWAQRGLLEPDEVVGRMFLFPKAETKRLVKKITTLREKGCSIDFIKEMLKK